MKTVVSSPWTFFFKFVFPAVWGGIFSYATASLFLGETTSTFSFSLFGIYIIRDQPDLWGKWVLLGSLVLGGVVCRIVCYPLKRVAVEGDHLLISNFRREISVPFANVWAGGFAGGEIDRRSLVTLVFKPPTAFGRSIKFAPASQEALDLVRARLRPELGDPVNPETESLGEDLRGRGTT